MKLESNQLSGPKIKAFLKIYALLKKTYKKEPFHVMDAVTKVNGKPEYGIWCYISDNLNIQDKNEAVKKKLIPLDLQNACHCFAGRGKSKVVDKDTGQKYQLLNWQKRMTYNIRMEATSSST